MKLLTITFFILISIFNSYAQRPVVSTVQFEYAGTPLEMDQFETTLKEFKDFINATGYQTSAEKTGHSYALINSAYKITPGVNWRHDIKGRLIDISVYDSLPVGRISPLDAENYCKWRGKRIPTIAEWEYAAMGGEQFKYSGANRATRVGWHGGNSWEYLHKIGLKASNKFKLYDMSGNIAEISIVKDENKYFVKGGSFFNDKQMLEAKDSGFETDPDYSFPNNGIRCIRNIK